MGTVHSCLYLQYLPCPSRTSFKMFLKGQGRRWPLLLALIVFLCTLVYFHKQLVNLPLPRIQSPLRSGSTIGNPSNVDTPLNLDGSKTHTEVYSVSTKDRKFQGAIRWAQNCCKHQYHPTSPLERHLHNRAQKPP